MQVFGILAQSNGNQSNGKIDALLPSNALCESERARRRWGRALRLRLRLWPHTFCSFQGCLNSLTQAGFVLHRRPWALALCRLMRVAREKGVDLWRRIQEHERPMHDHACKNEHKISQDL